MFRIKIPSWVALGAFILAAGALLWLHDRQVRARTRWEVSKDSLERLVVVLDRQMATDREVRARRDAELARLQQIVARARPAAARAETIYAARGDSLAAALPDTLLPLLARLQAAHGTQVAVLAAGLDAAQARGDSLAVSEASSRRLLGEAIGQRDAALRLVRTAPKPTGWGLTVTGDQHLAVSVCATRQVARVPLVGLGLNVGGCYRT